MPSDMSGYSLQDRIIVWDKSYSYADFSRLIDRYLPSDVLEKYTAYQSLIRAISIRYNAETNREKKLYYKQIGEVLQIGRAAHDYELSSNVHEIVPGDWYNLIVSNIHGSYEYGTYETAMMLVKQLEVSSETGWFIIPTLNPDGLIEYEQHADTSSFYLEGRDNMRGVDLNRNYCTTNFKDTDFVKYGKQLKTSVWWCESEIETRVMVSVLQDFYFKNAITFHSAWGILYVPDNSITDTQVVALWKDILSILPGYNFYPNTNSQILTQASIKKYEMDEGGTGVFTGTLETYIYETYGIPTVLIEFENHGDIEYNLKNIFSLDL